MSSRRKTHEEFISELKDKQPELYDSLEFLSEYETAKEYILIKDKYGICKNKPDNLLNGKYPSIVSAIDKDEYFIGMVKIHNPQILDKIIGFGKYNGMLNSMVIYTEFGDCKSQPTSILAGMSPSLKSAINKIDYIKNILKHKYPKLFNEILEYGKYNGYHDNILVRNKYGWCSVQTSNLLSGKTPTIVTALDKNEYFKNRAVEIHGDLYDYSKTVYNMNKGKVCITCKKHGDFQQNPDNHLYGFGCEKCGNESGVGGYNKTNADRNKELWSKIDAIVYTIKCKLESESFYKIGITVKENISDRFNGRFPYEYDTIYKINTNLYDATFIENELHSIFLDYKYKPSMYFGGWTECFSEIDLDKIKAIQTRRE